MGIQFEWNENFNIGVEIIDKEHKRLFKIINKLFALREENETSQWACQEGIKFFKKHALNHFADEEAYMASIDYEWLEQHKFLHDGFRKYTLPALERELEQAEYSPDAVEHFLGVCAGWLVGHTLTEDQAITREHVKKWTNILPGEELDIIKKAIIQIIFDMFRLESHLISNSYKGDKFGNGLYYRLIYSTKNNKNKQEIILVFEEKLLINTVGKIMGVKTNKLDNMLLHATRYMARRFAESVMEQFPVDGIFELKTENLLTYEQFEKVYEKENPPVSLLFDTGAGYFAYCSSTAHILESEVGMSIEADNALNGVKEYLKKREILNSKPRILVVDDSMTVRQYLCELLGDDYDVTPAESSVAAIRIMAVNKPELVLLDYEMPVCDGRQMLEMLRSDKEFMNTPVIFLTGRSDFESVKKVKDLKPAGYLLKYLKSEDVKKSIDNFFSMRKK